MSAVEVFLLALTALTLPEAEDPIPDRVGLDAAFIGAGFGAVLAGILCAWASKSSRETAMKWGGVIGFLAGTGFYLLALLVQVS